MATTAEKALAKLKPQPEKPAVPSTFAGMNSAEIAKVLDMYKLQISNVLPQDISPDRIIQIITTIIARNPNIANCTIPSIIGATIQCAIFGFDPSPEMGLCYFVPRQNRKTGLKEIQFQLGYKGYIQLAYRSNEIKMIYSYVVHENDRFKYQLGLNRDIKHEPDMENPGVLRAVYAVYQTKSGGTDFAVMTKKEVYAIKAKSDAKGSEYSPWNVASFEPDMWRKTVLKKLLKTAPLSIEDRRSLAVDNAVIYDDSLQAGGQGADLSKIIIDEDENGNGSPAEPQPSAQQVFIQEWMQQEDNDIQIKFDEFCDQIPNFNWASVVKACNLPANTGFENLKKSSRVDVLWHLKSFVK